MTAATAVWAAWAALMAVPIILVTYVLPKFDAWLDRRPARRDERAVVTGAEQYLRDRAGRRNARTAGSGGLFAIPNPEDDPS